MPLVPQVPSVKIPNGEKILPYVYLSSPPRTPLPITNFSFPKRKTFLRAKEYPLVIALSVPALTLFRYIPPHLW